MLISGLLEATALPSKVKTYIASILLPMLLQSLLQQKFAPDTASEFKPEYDYVVIGAGPGGAVVSSRLSEKECASVLLLEAGGNPPPESEIPAYARYLWNTDLDWVYHTVPQKHTANLHKDKIIKWNTGKGVGGSSLINSMLYVRGNRKNYDDWASEYGAEGWSYDDVLPYYIKSEDNRNIQDVDAGFHGTGGPMTVETKNYISEFEKPVIEAAKNLGFKYLDSNGRNQTGMDIFQQTTRNGQRCSVAKAYLVPADHRPNFDILPRAFVKKILIENNRAVGVVFDHGGSEHLVTAKKEVILSAGAVNSAQLLMLSGIGPQEELQKHDIPVVADLPVGKNLQNQASCVVNFEFPPEVPDVNHKLFNVTNMREYIDNRTGPWSAPDMYSIIAFLNGMTPDDGPDVPLFQLFFQEATPANERQLGLSPGSYEQIYGPYQDRALFVCYAQVLVPKSRGSVRLNSSDPYDPPLIDPNYFADDSDMKIAIEGLKTCHKLGTSEPMRKIGVKPFTSLYPGCEQFADDEDKYYECSARSIVFTMHHPVGTATMGDPKQSTTVVDPKLRVKGISGLRVVDASVIPRITAGNTYNPTVMVAEKAADLIKEDMGC